MKNKLERINKILQKSGRKITIADLNNSGLKPIDKKSIMNSKVSENLPILRARSSIRPSRVGMPLLNKSVGKLKSILIPHF